jgi:hypothetical protein
MYPKFYSEYLNGIGHFGDPDADRRIILKWILKIDDVSFWTRFNWIRICTVAGSCEHGLIHWIP